METAHHTTDSEANMTDDGWESDRWWRVVAPDGSLWCESDKADARDRLRPGDRLEMRDVVAAHRIRLASSLNLRLQRADGSVSDVRVLAGTEHVALDRASGRLGARRGASRLRKRLTASNGRLL